MSEKKQRIAAYGLLFNERGEVLLSRASAKSDYPGRFFLPGGGVKHGESPLQALRREVMEESGLTSSGEHLLGLISDVDRIRSGSVILHSVRVIFVSQSVRGAPRKEVGGTTDLSAWYKLDIADELPLMPYVREALSMYLLQAD